MLARPDAPYRPLLESLQPASPEYLWERDRGIFRHVARHTRNLFRHYGDRGQEDPKNNLLALMTAAAATYGLMMWRDKARAQPEHADWEGVDEEVRDLAQVLWEIRGLGDEDTHEDEGSDDDDSTDEDGDGDSDEVEDRDEVNIEAEDPDE